MEMKQISGVDTWLSSPQRRWLAGNAGTDAGVLPHPTPAAQLPQRPSAKPPRTETQQP